MSGCRRRFAAILATAAFSVVAQPASAAPFTVLASLDGSGFGLPLAVSADGSKVVGTSYPTVGPARAFIWDPGRGMRGLLDESTDRGSGAIAVSADGSKVLGYREGGFFLWDEVEGATSIDLGFTPFLMSGDASTFVGRTVSGNATVVWDAANGIRELGNLPGGDALAALRISADGSTIVGRDITGQGEEAFVWATEGGTVSLGDLPGGGFGSAAIGVSSDGSKIVGGGSSDRGGEAFLWDAVNGMVGLGFPPAVGSLDPLSLATDVSGDGSVVLGVAQLGTFVWDAKRGMIVGTGLFLGQRMGYVAVIPEPSTSMFVFLGLAGLAARKRRAVRSGTGASARR